MKCFALRPVLSRILIAWLLLAQADILCAHFSDLPTDGSGLPADVLALAKAFSKRYDKPTLVVSPDLVKPNYNEDGKR